MQHPSRSTFATPAAFDRHTIETPRAARSKLHRAIGYVAWWAGFPARLAKVRREMALLGGMSDCELSDIGLTRQDLRDASALPLSEPPEALFRQRLAERGRPAGLGR